MGEQTATTAQMAKSAVTKTGTPKKGQCYVTVRWGSLTLPPYRLAVTPVTAVPQTLLHCFVLSRNNRNKVCYGFVGCTQP
jgi:hypothetical protein